MGEGICFEHVANGRASKSCLITECAHLDNIKRQTSCLKCIELVLRKLWTASSEICTQRDSISAYRHVRVVVRFLKAVFAEEFTVVEGCVSRVPLD